MKPIVSVILLILVSSLTSCFSYKEIELNGVKGIKLNQVTQGGVEIQAGIHIKNPNGYKIKIKGIEADMMLNGNKVGNITLTKKVVLPRHSDEVQTFIVNTQLSNLISAMPSLMFNKEAKLQLKGHINGKVFIFRRKYPLEAEERISTQDLNLF